MRSECQFERIVEYYFAICLLGLIGMLRDSSSISFDYAPISSGYEVVFRAYAIVFINLSRFDVTTDQHMKASILRLVLFNVQVVSSESHLIAGLTCHQSTVHLLLEFINACTLIHL